MRKLPLPTPDKFKVYRGQVEATIEQYGGKYVVRGGATETAEGGWEPKRLVIIEFESMETGQAVVLFAGIQRPDEAAPRGGGFNRRVC